jgi:hypothetical protein
MAAGALGAFFSSLGASKNEKRKEALMERLQKEAEERADQRDQNREDRALKREQRKVAGNPKFVMKDGGSAENVFYNMEGTEIKREAASQNEIEDYKMTQQERKAKLEDALLGPQYKQSLIDVNKANAADIPARRAAERAESQSRIHENEAQAKYYLNGGSRKPSSIEAAINGDDSAGVEILGKWAEDRGKQMIKDGVMTQYEYDKWLQGIIRTARQFGRDPRQVFEEQAKILSD